MNEPVDAEQNQNDDNPSYPLKNWWNCELAQLLGELDVAVDHGLSSSSVQQRLGRYGSNRLREPNIKSVWVILWNQLKSPIVFLLVAATIASLSFAQWVEAIAIVVVIVINTVIGFLMELRAVRSMEALRKLGDTKVIVRRDGKSTQVSAEELVPGDIVILDAGDSITADLRIVESSKLQANESALTGESIPVGKRVGVLPAETALADRKNMLFKGTFLTRGAGVGVVVCTGMESELGRIASLVDDSMQNGSTPLEKRLESLAKQLVWVTLVITAIVVVLGIVRGKELLLMIETGVALAVSAIPEGLPIVATLALARGMLRMVRQNVLIRRLSAVETLGATSVICTDKTGTITENRMTLTRVVVDTGMAHFEKQGIATWEADDDSRLPKIQALVQQALEIGALCNNATFDGFDGTSIEGTGDPMELALLVGANALNIKREILVKENPEVEEIAFDPNTKMMTTFHQLDEMYLAAVKGAPEEVISRCTHVMSVGATKSEMEESQREAWFEQNALLAEQGLRVLAIASRIVDAISDDPYHDLTLVGLVAMEDPPRIGVASAISACKRAGIKFVMVTGDQPVTAQKIAHDVGLIDDRDASVVSGREIHKLLGGSESDRKRLLETSVFARVSPEEKLQLISLHQNNNAIVAMTGDGVNDAPALEKSDIGVAMGQRGTQVARDSADMVLQDDSLESIVTAIHEGRVVFGNIRKFVLYLLSCNASEVLAIGIASMLNWPLPLLPLHILFLNLVTDVFPALALGAGKGEADIMERQPRNRDEPILHSRNWWEIAIYASIMTLAVLAASFVARHYLELPSNGVVTVSFLTMALTQLWHVFNMRDSGSSLFLNDITTNRFVWYALAICIAILLGAVLLPGVSTVLQLTSPGWSGWLTAVALSLVPVLYRLIFHR